MGLMNGIFKVLGFESEEKPKKIKKQSKTKASFSLKDENISRPDQIDGVPVYYPTTFEQTSEFVEFVKKNRAIIISLECVSVEDGERILDYLNGFTFGRNAKFITLNEKKLYLILPEGMEIEE